MSETNARLPEVLAAAYEPYVRAVLAGRSISEPPGLDDAIEEGRRWLEEALSRMLSLPFPSQDRGPLELFQDAMRFPTKVLADARSPCRSPGTPWPATPCPAISTTSPRPPPATWVRVSGGPTWLGERPRRPP